jgi:hypothetical protein
MMRSSLTTYRVAEKIVSMFGWSVDKMTVWKAVQKTGQEIEFRLDPDGHAHGEADGAGIPITGIKKRGKELKVFVQHKKGGGVRVAGIDIGNYGSGWEKLFKDSIGVWGHTLNSELKISFFFILWPLRCPNLMTW